MAAARQLWVEARASVMNGGTSSAVEDKTIRRTFGRPLQGGFGGLSRRDVTDIVF